RLQYLDEPTVVPRGIGRPQGPVRIRRAARRLRQRILLERVVLDVEELARVAFGAVHARDLVSLIARPDVTAAARDQVDRLGKQIALVRVAHLLGLTAGSSVSAF